jgi:hypothetical protein
MSLLQGNLGNLATSYFDCHCAHDTGHEAWTLRILPRIPDAWQEL